MMREVDAEDKGGDLSDLWRSGIYGGLYIIHIWLIYDTWLYG